MFLYFFLKPKLALVSQGDNESNQDILEEVGAIKSVLRKQSLETRTETAVTQEDVSISLMVDLQEIQDKEIERIIEKMHGMVRQEMEPDGGVNINKNLKYHLISICIR